MIYTTPCCDVEVELGQCSYVVCPKCGETIDVHDLIEQPKKSKLIYKQKKYQSALIKVREPKTFRKNYKH